DLDLDLVLPAFGREIELWRNDGGFRLHRATAGSGLDSPFGSSAMTQGALADLDRDGDLDLLLLADRLYAFRNDGHPRFSPMADSFEPIESNAALAKSQLALGDLD